MQQFLPGIHGLRAVAAISVILFHQAPNLKLPPIAAMVATHGGLGVHLFFVLSAFSLAQSTLHRVGQPDWVHDFGIRRFFRIVPMFYAVLLAFCVHDYFVWNKIYSFNELVLNLTFTYDFVPGRHESIVWAGWTVGVEILFYLLFPMIFAFVQTWRAALVFAVFAAVAGTVVYVELQSAPGVPGSFAYEHLGRSMPAFAIGLLAFFGLRALNAHPVLAKFATPLCAAGTIIGVYLAMTMSFDPIARYDLLYWNLTFGALAMWQAQAPGWLMSSRLFQFFGERSYSVYLLHAPIVFYLKPAYAKLSALIASQTLAYAASVVLALACIAIVTSITYRLVEVPAIRFGARLIRARRERASARTLPA